MDGDTSNGRIGVAIFGYGRAGHIHFINISKEFRVRLKYVVDLDTARVEEALKTYHQEHVKVLSPTEADILFKDPSIRAVFVCAPTFAHEEICRRALQHGKAVFCEKPIANDIKGTIACYEEAEKAGLPLFCSFNRRFDPSIRDVYNRIKNNEVGLIHTIKTCSRDHPLPPIEYLKVSGGIFHDCGVHDIDFVCWMLGEYPESVYTQAHVHVKEIADMDDVDTVAITMKFPSGTLAMLDLSRNANYGYDQRVEVFGSKGMIVSDVQRSSAVHFSDKLGTGFVPLKHSFPQRYAESYIIALSNFLDVIEDKKPLEILKDDTLTVTEIAAACEESHRTGLPVHLNLKHKQPTCIQETPLINGAA